MGGMVSQVKDRLRNTALWIFISKYKWRHRSNLAIQSRETARKVVELHMAEASAEEKTKAVEDILDAARKYRFSAEEYFYFHLAERSDEERGKFVSDLNRISFCERVNRAKDKRTFDDKVQCAEVFKEYFRRDVCAVKSAAAFDDFEKFVQKHPKFIVKPLLGSRGQGVRIIDANTIADVHGYLKELVDAYCGNGNRGFIAEELVVQRTEMAQFHPSSVNTVRVATVRYDEGTEVVAAFFRTGRGGNIVDNAGAGGVFGVLDLATGTVVAAADEFGDFYTHHPDSNLPMVGFTVPQWEEAVEFAKKLSMVLPKTRYVGWDLALSEKGWVMIEGNSRGQFVWQIPSQKGFLDEINAILRRLKKPELKKLGV